VILASVIWNPAAFPDAVPCLENRIAEGEHDISDEAGWMPESSDKALGVALGIQLRE
jgi:hypothetical protein